MAERTPEQRLMIYMQGWMKGSSASAFTDEQMNDSDFANGYADGRGSRQVAYNSASSKYGATLSPLRLTRLNDPPSSLSKEDK